MDNSSFSRQLAKGLKAKGLDLNVEDVKSYSEKLTSRIVELLSASDTVAVPGFGTLVPEKSEEHVETSGDGTRMLVPPSINVTFTPGSRLKKATAPKM